MEIQSPWLYELEVGYLEAILMEDAYFPGDPDAGSEDGGGRTCQHLRGPRRLGSPEDGEGGDRQLLDL